MLKIVGDINLTDGYFDVGYGVGIKLKQGFDPFHNIQRNDEVFLIGNFEGWHPRHLIRLAIQLCSSG